MRCFMTKISFFIILLFPVVGFAFTTPPTLTVSKPSGSTYTVCASGCDFATLEAADGSVSPGDTIQVKAGNYGNFDWDQSGSSGNEIVIEAFGDGDAIFQLTASRVDGNYVIFDGGADYELRFDADDVPDGSYCVRIGGSNVTMYRIDIYDGGQNVGVSGGMFHFGLLGDNIKIYNCLIENGYSGGIYLADGDNIEIRNNRVGRHQGAGIQLNPHEVGYHSDEIYVTGNAVYDNGNVWEKPGIVFLSSDNDALYDVYIYNNLLWDNYYGIRRSQYTQNNLHARVYNNSIYSSTTRNFRIDAGGNATIRNNNSSGGGSADSFSGTYTLSDTENSPSYVSTTDTSDDFLKITVSNNGYDTNAPVTIDYWGSSRDASTPDIGAHEFGGAGAAPSQASNPDPADTEITVSITADLSWTNGSGTTEVDVYFEKDDSSPDILVIDGDGESTISYDPGTMDYDGTYYWQVNCTNENGTTNGVIWSFTTESAPVASGTTKFGINGQAIGAGGVIFSFQ